MFLKRGVVFRLRRKRVDGLFLIINSGSGLIGHAIFSFFFIFVFGDYLWDVCF